MNLVIQIFYEFSEEILDKNQNIGDLQEELGIIQEDLANTVEELPFSSKSIGIGDGNVFESSEDSEEEKDQVFDLEPPPEPVDFIEQPKPKKYTRQQKNDLMELSINSKLMTLFEVIGINTKIYRFNI